MVCRRRGRVYLDTWHMPDCISSKNMNILKWHYYRINSSYRNDGWIYPNKYPSCCMNKTSRTMDCGLNKGNFIKHLNQYGKWRQLQMWCRISCQISTFMLKATHLTNNSCLYGWWHFSYCQMVSFQFPSMTFQLDEQNTSNMTHERPDLCIHVIYWRTFFSWLLMRSEWIDECISAALVTRLAIELHGWPGK